MTDDALFSMIEQALDKAGLPYDEPETAVLYGKELDITIVEKGITKRLSGVCKPARIEDDWDDFFGKTKTYAGYCIDPLKSRADWPEFSPWDIVTIHSIAPYMTHDEAINEIYEAWAEM